MESIRKPLVNAQLDGLNWLRRAAEVFSYTILCIEHWISPEGNIREWLRKNLRWSAVLVIPALTVFPIVTLALWEVKAWVGAMTTIVGKLVFLPILALLALVSIIIVFRIIGVFKR